MIAAVVLLAARKVYEVEEERSKDVVLLDLVPGPNGITMLPDVAAAAAAAIPVPARGVPAPPAGPLGLGPLVAPAADGSRGDPPQPEEEEDDDDIIL